MPKKDALTEAIPEAVKQDLLSVTDPQEKSYRANILAAIERNINNNGPHKAQPHDSRARQFMPFAALKGYADMVRQEEDKY